MPQEVLLAFIAAGGIVLGAAVGKLLEKLPTKGASTQDLVTRFAAEIERLTERVDELGARLDAGERVGRQKDDYIHALRAHIALGNPPPPPPYPDGLKQ